MIQEEEEWARAKGGIIMDTTTARVKARAKEKTNMTRDMYLARVKRKDHIPNHASTLVLIMDTTLRDG